MNSVVVTRHAGARVAEHVQVDCAEQHPAGGAGQSPALVGNGPAVVRGVEHSEETIGRRICA